MVANIPEASLNLPFDVQPRLFSVFCPRLFQCTGLLLRCDSESSQRRNQRHDFAGTTQVFHGPAAKRSLNVTHGDHEASEHARRESLGEADLTHQGVKARVGAERIDERIEKQESNLRISFVVSPLEPRKRLVLFVECCIN
jgi:hypothetical protein